MWSPKKNLFFFFLLEFTYLFEKQNQGKKESKKEGGKGGEEGVKDGERERSSLHWLLFKYLQ